MQRDLADMPDVTYVGRDPLPLRIRLAAGSPFTWSWRKVDGDPLPTDVTVEIRFGNGDVWVGQRASDYLFTWMQSTTDVDAVLTDSAARSASMWWCQTGTEPYVIARGDVWRK